MALMWVGAFELGSRISSGSAQPLTQQETQRVPYYLVTSFGSGSYSLALTPDDKFIGVTAGTGADLWDIAKKRRLPTVNHIRPY
jgi:hypothetical protein